jgi:hypothetical protein
MYDDISEPVGLDDISVATGRWIAFEIFQEAFTAFTCALPHLASRQIFSKGKQPRLARSRKAEMYRIPARPQRGRTEESRPP